MITIKLSAENEFSTNFDSAKELVGEHVTEETEEVEEYRIRHLTDDHSYRHTIGHIVSKNGKSYVKLTCQKQQCRHESCGRILIPITIEALNDLIKENLAT